MLNKIKKEMKNRSSHERARINSYFFKTGKGQYGERDKFIGLTMPEQRKIAKKYANMSYKNVKELLSSKIHEERMTALLILILRYNKASNSEKERIIKFYLDNIKYINNWDLVDVTAPKIIGSYLLDKDKSILYKLVKSKNLWERRIAIISTFEFIKSNQFKDTLKISEILLNDDHDLIHKAVGWMLREIGKRDLNIEEDFLKKYSKQMPRTMLRYAIEKFEENKRQSYLKK